MGKQRTDKSKYISSYGGQHVTAAQYITELVCEKIAKKDGKTLTHQFWAKPEWSKTFRHQIMLANRLLKSYSAPVIVKALREYRANKIYSLGAKHILGPLLKKHQTKEKVESMLPLVTSKDIVKSDVSQKPRPKFSKNTNLRSRLNE